uniref:Cation efflux protein transmembrane domain-containing protein n=1 Tax=Solanum lycopersicum TaxID=4081 RepID=A0A3Q7FLQ6_SOLLC
MADNQQHHRHHRPNRLSLPPRAAVPITTSTPTTTRTPYPSFNYPPSTPTPTPSKHRVSYLPTKSSPAKTSSSSSSRDPFHQKNRYGFFSFTRSQYKPLLAKSFLLAIVFLLRFQALRYCGAAAMILAEISGNIASRFISEGKSRDLFDRNRIRSYELSLWGLLICGLLLWVSVRNLDPVDPNYLELGLETSDWFTTAVMKPLRHILGDRKSRKIALFLLINTAYMVVEFAAGLMSNSLGLISDACHMLFDCAALAIGLYASYISRLPANGQFNYGRGRFEVLSGYANAVLLVLVGALIVLESFERILDPQEVSTNSLLSVSIGGLLVNIVGLIFFHEEHHHAHGGSCSHSHSHSHSKSDTDCHSVTEKHHHQHRHIDHNMEGIFLHVLADTLGSVGVVISTLLIKYKGWLVADPACSIFISVLIISSVIPLLRNSAEILLQRVPRAHEHDVKEAVNDVMKIKGLSGIQKLHVWSFTNTDVIGTLHLLVSSETDKSSAKTQVSEIFRHAGVKDLTMQVECIQS